MASRERDGNRSKDEIMGEMLEQMLSPARKTSVMYNARLSYTQLANYFDLLLRLGLITRAEGDDNHSGYWVTTEKGRKFVDAYGAIRAISR